MPDDSSQSAMQALSALAAAVRTPRPARAAMPGVVHLGPIPLHILDLSLVLSLALHAALVLGLLAAVVLSPTAATPPVVAEPSVTVTIRLSPPDSPALKLSEPTISRLAPETLPPPRRIVGPDAGPPVVEPAVARASMDWTAAWEIAAADPLRPQTAADMPEPDPPARVAATDPPPPEVSPALPDDPPTRPAAAASSPLTHPVVASLPTPRYPSASRDRGEQGLVELEVEVLPDGRPGAIRVLSDPGHRRLVDAAIAAVRAARFQPATLDGRPIRSVIVLPFRFELR